MSEHYATYSQITTHRRCPQRWMYAYDRRLEKIDPEDVRVELELGNWWHALRAADSIERGLSKGSLQWIPKRISTVDDGPVIDLAPLDELREQFEMHGSVRYVQLVLDEAETWWDTLSDFEKESWQGRVGGTVVERLRYMNARWHERWDGDLAYESPLAVELYWRRELPALTDHETGEKRDPDTVMVGYVDEVFYDERRNIVVARDHKTHKTLGIRSSAEDMMDSQLQVYAWGASPTVSAWGYGPIKAVAYDRVRSTAPKSPAVTGTGTLSKSVTDYDLATYLSFTAGPDGVGVPWGVPDTYYVSGKKKDQPKFGTYQAEDEIIAKLSDPAALSAWQQRTLVPLNRNIVTTHLRAAVDTSLDMISTRERARQTREAGRNLTDACKWCPFQELCRAEMTGGAFGEYELDAMYLRERPQRSR